MTRSLKGWKTVKILRIGSQAVFLFLFLIMFLISLDPFSASINPFLRFDPLIFLTNIKPDPLTIVPILGIVLLTLIIGRFYCGWVCPLGSVIDLLDRLMRPVRKINPLSKKGLLKKGWLLTYPPSLFVLGALLVTIFFTPPVLQFFHPHVWIVRIFSLSGAGLIFLVFLIGLSGISTRMWCTLLCPLGALYGLLGSAPLFKLGIAECVECGRCDRCPTGATVFRQKKVIHFRCTLCFEFEHQCPEAGFIYGRKKPGFDSSRRTFLRNSALFSFGLLSGALLSAFNRSKRTSLLRPPGVSDEETFIKRCLRCFQCVRSCPNDIIRITGLEEGWDSLGTPHIEFGEYGCDYYCRVCQEVCPNFAIPLLPLPEKQSARIGTATIDETLCVVYAEDTSCIVCEEFCPVPQKAILLHERTILKGGEKIVLSYPEVVSGLCIGCGACEARCPASSRAITVGRI